MAYTRELYDSVVTSLMGEGEASNEYVNMMELVKASDLPDSDKALLFGIFYKINCDEASHTALLNIVKDVLSLRLEEGHK